LLALLLWPASLEWLLRLLFPGEAVLVYPMKKPAVLVTEHLAMVLTTSGLAALAGFAGALVAFLSGSASLKRLIVFSGTLLQTVPPMAVLALLIPLAGFGNDSLFWALFFLGVLPVFHNAYGAMETVPEEVTAAARGVGLSPPKFFPGYPPAGDAGYSVGNPRFTYHQYGNRHHWGDHGGGRSWQAGSSRESASSAIPYPRPGGPDRRGACVNPGQLV